MRTTLAIAAIGWLFATAALADSVRFAAGTFSIPTQHKYPVVLLRSGGQCYGSTTYRLVGVRCPSTQTQTYPPTTNDAVNYVDTSVGEMVNMLADSFINTKMGGTYASAQTGWYYQAIGGSTGEKGYFHVFSAGQPTNAAYYYNTALQSMIASPTYGNNGAGVISNINPAYKQLRFDSSYVFGAVTNIVWSFYSGQPMCSGSVTTVEGGADNMLANSDVMVYWRTNNTYPWEALQNFSITNNGDFRGVNKLYMYSGEFMVGMRATPAALPRGYAFQPLRPLSAEMIDMLFVATGESSGPSNLVFLRDGASLCPTGYAAQALSGVNITLPPTNLANCVDGSIRQMHKKWLPMGTDDSGWGDPMGPGELCILDDVWRDNTTQCMFRVFSAVTPTNAAYYGDSEIAFHDCTWPELDHANHVCTQPTLISNVNPVYVGLCFDGYPVKYHDGVPCISGSVNTVAGGDNHLLPNSAVMVYWRSQPTNIWRALSNFVIAANGDFSGSYGGGTEVCVGMQESPDALPSSLAIGGQGPVVPLPEPALALALCAAGILGARSCRSRNTTC